MEMIFLQQALGVASEQLPNSVIRSISRSEHNQSMLTKALASELTEEHAALYKEDHSSDHKSYRQSDGDSTRISMEEEEDEDEEQIEEPLPASTIMKAINLAQSDEKLGQKLGIMVPKTPDEARTYAVTMELKEAIRLSNEILTERANEQALTPNSDKSRSEVDLSKLSPSAANKISILTSETLLDQFDPSNTGSSWAAWVKVLADSSDALSLALQPSFASAQNRFQVFKYVRDLICKTLHAQLFPIGSFVTKTYLPDGDIDVTAFVPKLTDDSWFVKINEALCLAAYQRNKGDSDGISVSNVSFVNTEIKMIRSMINGVSVDISTNQVQSLFADSLIERVDRFIGKNHLFKRSLLLLKVSHC